MINRHGLTALACLKISWIPASSEPYCEKVFTLTQESTRVNMAGWDSLERHYISLMQKLMLKRFECDLLKP